MEHRLEIQGLDLYLIEEGPPDGRPVLLLHGFPDSADVWRHQIPVLAGSGYRVIAPDLRGFGRSEKPQGVEHYKMRLVVRDILGILDGLGVDEAAVVGHDFGASAAWALTMAAPDRVERLAVVSVGHPAAYWSSTGLDEREKSWYVLWFLFPDVPEAGLRADNWAFLREFSRDAHDLDRWIAHCEAAPGNLTAMLNWYRANINPAVFGRPTAPQLPPITCPVLGIWSDGDAYTVEEQMVASRQFVSGPWRYERIEGCSHWIPVDAPEQLNALVLPFLASQ